jgi:uncharacterized protein (DUF488 family)
MSALQIFTIGHSTRSHDEFLQLLEAYEIAGLADIRTVPRSRRHPHFAGEALEASLPAQGITYRHFAALGGLRRPRPDSPNGAWQHPGFRGYADHMQAPIFREAIEELLAFSASRVVAIMCAEAKWWQCHRRLTADTLVARGVQVRHILSATHAPAHELTPFARVAGHEVWYPGLV